MLLAKPWWLELLEFRLRNLRYCLTKGADSIMSPLLTTPLGAWEEEMRSEIFPRLEPLVFEVWVSWIAEVRVYLPPWERDR